MKILKVIAVAAMVIAGQQLIAGPKQDIKSFVKDRENATIVVKNADKAELRDLHRKIGEAIQNLEQVPMTAFGGGPDFRRMNEMMKSQEWQDLVYIEKLINERLAE